MVSSVRMSLGRSLQIACLACRQSHPNLAHMIRQTISQVGLDGCPKGRMVRVLGKGEGSQGSTKKREGKIERTGSFCVFVFCFSFFALESFKVF